MNTPVNFETKQLLFNKGWKYELGFDESGHRVKNSLAEQKWNKGDLTYVDIAISEVVMWLYEKYGIWISVYTMDKWLSNGDDKEQLFDYSLKQMKLGLIDISKKPEEFNSPTEAYENAIKHCLNNLI